MKISLAESKTFNVSTDPSTATALASLAHPEIVAQINKLVEIAKEANIEFGPTLSDDTILCFEHENNCTLPRDYRLFLLFAGNGASGNARSKIMPLSIDVRQEGLSKPFTLEDEWRQSGEYEEAEDGREELHPYMIAISEAQEILSQGCLILRDDFGRCSYLVVTGKDTGQIRNLEDDYYQDGSWSVHITDEGDFLSWCEDLLQRKY